MFSLRTPALVLALSALPGVVDAQGVVVDEGTFEISVDGVPVGTETFSIRRAGLGRDATVIAMGVVKLDRGGNDSELRPLLVTLLPDGAASQYELEVTGEGAMRLVLFPQNRRFVSRIRSGDGEEEREFLARPGTRVLENGVAHQYYFLRSVREGSVTPAIEPRSRLQLQISASAAVEEELTLGAISVPARRVTFTVDGQDRTVWYDQQDRVLRVEIPSLGYRAVRSDLVGE